MSFTATKQAMFSIINSAVIDHYKKKTVNSSLEKIGGEIFETPPVMMMYTVRLI